MVELSDASLDSCLTRDPVKGKVADRERGRRVAVDGTGGLEDVTAVTATTEAWSCGRRRRKHL
jgi:hypothetical protein